MQLPKYHSISAKTRCGSISTAEMCQMFICFLKCQALKLTNSRFLSFFKAAESKKSLNKVIIDGASYRIGTRSIPAHPSKLNFGPLDNMPQNGCYLYESFWEKKLYEFLSCFFLLVGRAKFHSVTESQLDGTPAEGESYWNMEQTDSMVYHDTITNHNNIMTHDNAKKTHTIATAQSQTLESHPTFTNACQGPLIKQSNHLLSR